MSCAKTLIMFCRHTKPRRPEVRQTVGNGSKKKIEMNIISSIQKKYPNLLKDKNILACTHATDATESFLDAMSCLGAKLFYIPIPYSKNHTSIENIKKISNLRLIKTRALSKIIGP